MLNRKEVMNHAHLFVVVVSVQAQIGPFFLTLSLSLALSRWLSHTHEHTLALSRNHRGSELTLKPQHFVILYLMEVMVEIIHKEHRIRFIVTEEGCVSLPATAEGHVRHHRGESSYVSPCVVCFIKFDLIWHSGFNVCPFALVYHRRGARGCALDVGEFTEMYLNMSAVFIIATSGIDNGFSFHV